MDRIISHGDQLELMVLRSYVKSLSNNVPNLNSDYIQKELINISLTLDVIIKNIERRSR